MSEEEEAAAAYQSWWAQVLFAIYPKVPAFLSILGSGTIMYEILAPRRPRRTKLGPLQRALVGMSMYDIFSSSGFFISTW
jgi:hypothetical protein